MMGSRILLLAVLTLVSAPSWANQMTYTFANPQFSGEGYSQHVLTIEQTEFSRQQAIDAQKKADAAAAASAKGNTVLSQFLTNLESRIYAQLSLQLTNAMFSDGSTSGTLDLQGSTISWIKDTANQTINLTVIDPQGNKTDVTIPIGSFKF